MLSAITRIREYYQRRGLKETLIRTGVAFKRAFFANHMVVFYCDLSNVKTSRVNAPTSLRIERFTRAADVAPTDLQEMTSFWNAKQARRNIQERFEQGASLWLVKSGDILAGYGWTIQGRTIEPYYFPLCTRDVHLFDFHIFPQHRGHGINPYLVTYILQDLSSQLLARAFIEAAEWNHAQLSSLKKTPFFRLGIVKSNCLFSRKYISWSPDAVGQRTDRMSN